MRKYLSTVVISVLFIYLLVLPIYAEEVVLLSPAQMNEDVDFLVKTLEEIHPLTLNGYSNAQKDIIKDIYDKIRQPLDKSQFYFLLDQLAVSFKDSHTSLEFRSDEWANLPIVWLNDGIIVNNTLGELRKGDKILSIANKNENELFQELEKIIPADNIYSIKTDASNYLTKGEVLRHLGLVSNNKVTIKVEREGHKLDIIVPLEPNNKLKDNANLRHWIGWNIDKEDSIGYIYFDKSIHSEEYINELEEFFRQVRDNKQKVHMIHTLLRATYIKFRMNGD